MIKSIKRKPIPNIFAMGNIDLIFQLEIKKQDFDIPISSLMKTVKDSQNFFKGFNLNKIQSIKDLSFLKGEKNILVNNIKIKGGNQTLNHLLLANQELKNKCIIDYIGFGPLKFEGEEAFFNDIFKYVTLKNFLIINARPLDENAKSTFAIEIKYNGETKTIHPQPSKSKKDEGKQKNEKKEENKIKEDLINEYKNKKNTSSNPLKPRVTRPESILNRMKLSLKKYDLIFLNYSDFKQIPQDFQMDDLFELLNYFKKNGSIIFIDFYNQPKELSEEEKDDKNKKTKEENLKEINDQNKLYELSQIFFFDTEQAEKILRQDYEYTSQNNSKNKELLDNTKIIDYFITKISNNKTKPNKTGLFLDKLDKFTVASLIKNKPDKKQYDFEFSPKYKEFVKNYEKKKTNKNNKNDNANKSKKDNQSTIDIENMNKAYDELVEANKNIIEEKRNEFSSILVSLFIHDSAYFTDSFYSLKLINETVQTTINIIKKKIELMKKPQENGQDNAQDNLQDNVQDNLEDNLENNFEDNLEEDNLQDNLEDNLQEDNLQEDNLQEDNLQDNLQEDNLEENEGNE